MNIYNTGKDCAAVYIGTIVGGTEENGTKEIVFDSCDNYGSLYHTAGYSSMLISNGASWATSPANDPQGVVLNQLLKISNCHNYGIILGVNQAALVCGGDRYYDKEFTGITNAGGICKTSQPKVLTDYNGIIDLPTVEGATSYQITYTFWRDNDAPTEEDRAWGSYGETYVVTDTKGIELYSYKFINYADIKGSEYKYTITSTTIGNSEIHTVTISGNTYYIHNYEDDAYNGFAYRISKQPFITIFAYDNDMNLVDVFIYQYSNREIPSINS